MTLTFKNPSTPFQRLQMQLEGENLVRWQRAVADGATILGLVEWRGILAEYDQAYCGDYEGEWIEAEPGKAAQIQVGGAA